MNKKEFIKKLEQFIKETKAHESISGIESLEYAYDGSREWLYLILPSYGGQKRVDITWSSNYKIMESLLTLLGHWDDFPYLIGDEKYEEIG